MAMLTETYIEALLVDEDLADQVWELWELWSRGVIGDELAEVAWALVSCSLLPWETRQQFL